MATASADGDGAAATVTARPATADAVVGASPGGVAAGAAARRLLARLRRGTRVRAPVCELAVGALWAVTGRPVGRGSAADGVAAGAARARLAGRRGRAGRRAAPQAAGRPRRPGRLPRAAEPAAAGARCGGPRVARARSPPSSATASCTCCGPPRSAWATSSSPPHSARCSAPRRGRRSRSPPCSRRCSPAVAWPAPGAAPGPWRRRAAVVPHGPSMLRGGLARHRWPRPAEWRLRAACENPAVLRWITAGESHGPALVAVLEGMVAGVEITTKELAAELARRRLGYGRGARMKFEADELEVIGGVRHGLTQGGPVAIRIGNSRVAEVGDGDGGRPGRPRADRGPRPQRAAHPPAAGPRRPRRHDEVRLRRRPTRAGARQRPRDGGAGGAGHGGPGVPQAGARRRRRVARRRAGRGRGARRRRCPARRPATASTRARCGPTATRSPRRWSRRSTRPRPTATPSAASSR